MPSTFNWAQDRFGCGSEITIHYEKTLKTTIIHPYIKMFYPSSLTMSVLATLQPSVPAPRRRHFVLTTFSRSREGTSLQRINFRFRSTDDSASLHENQDKVPPVTDKMCLKES